MSLWSLTQHSFTFLVSFHVCLLAIIWIAHLFFLQMKIMFIIQYVVVLAGFNPKIGCPFIDFAVSHLRYAFKKNLYPLLKPWKVPFKSHFNAFQSRIYEHRRKTSCPGSMKHVIYDYRFGNIGFICCFHPLPAKHPYINQYSNLGETIIRQLITFMYIL